MVKRLYRILLLSTAVIYTLAGRGFATPASVNVRKGNELYRQGRYDEALKYYNEAGVDMPDSDIINFNKAVALYKKGDYEKAIENFSRVLLTEHPDLEAKAAYNIGNSKFRLGRLKENTDLALAVDLYRQALDYYKRAIELDQSDIDAKYNHEFVERRMKMLLDRLKRQEKQSQQEEKQQEEEKTSGSSEEAQEEKGEQEKEKKEEKQVTAMKEEEEGRKQREEEAMEPSGKEEYNKEISEEEARMILDRYDQQGRLWDSADRGRDRYYPPVLEDW